MSPGHSGHYNRVFCNATSTDRLDEHPTRLCRMVCESPLGVTITKSPGLVLLMTSSMQGDMHMGPKISPAGSVGLSRVHSGVIGNG